jgi:quercetin dioxygenase-like cupin family protein
MTQLRIQTVEPRSKSQEKQKEVVIDKILESSSNNKGLNISVVSFPQGVLRPWNSHDQDQYIWIISGKGVVRSQSRNHILSSGTLAFIPANMIHQHGASMDSSMTQLSIIGGNRPREKALPQGYTVF